MPDVGAGQTCPRVTVDAYVVAGIEDHISPLAELLQQHTTARRDQPIRALHQRSHRRFRQPAGQPEGHPPDRQGQPRRPRGVASRAAESHEGSWWPDFDTWLAERCGAPVDASTRLGGHGLEPLAEAPGTYVWET